MSSMIVLDQEKCIGCGSCLNGCSARIFEFDVSGQPPRIAENADERCIGCGHCVCLCPQSAISVGKITPQTITPVKQENRASYEEFLELVRQRRSSRHYKKDPVRQEDLDRLMELAQLAPTAKNLKLLKWIVVNNPETIHELAEITIDGIRGDDKFAGMVAAWDNDGYDWILRGAPCVIIAYAEEESPWTLCDSTIAVETIDLGAASLGIGTCWAGFLMVFLAKNEKLRQRLGLTPGQQTGAAIMVGYTEGEDYHFAPGRPVCDVRYVD